MKNIKVAIVQNAIIVTTREERKAAREARVDAAGRAVGAFGFKVIDVATEVAHLTAVGGKGVIAGYIDARNEHIGKMQAISAPVAE